MATENTPEVKKSFFQQQNIEFSFDRIMIKGLGGMAHGLFASLLIGTVLATVGTIIFRASGNPANAVGLFFNNNGAVGDTAIKYGINYFTSLAQGAAMAVAIGYAMSAPRYVLFSLCTVGIAANIGGGKAGPLAVFVIAVIAIFFGKLVAGRTPVDLIVTPSVTIIVGVLMAKLIGPPIGKIGDALGTLINMAVVQKPFVMGLLVSVLMGIILTLPISSAAICAALGILGLAGGAATAGCCAHMMGFAVCGYRDNKIGGAVAIGLGTSMLLVPNLLRKPILWLPPVITSAITGPLATVVFKMTQNQAAVSSGMGTCGIVGPLGVIFGWLTGNPAAVESTQAAVAAAEAAGDTARAANLQNMIPYFEASSVNGFNILGMLLICFILPVVLTWIFLTLFRKAGAIKDGDYTLT